MKGVIVQVGKVSFSLTMEKSEQYLPPPIVMSEWSSQ